MKFSVLLPTRNRLDLLSYAIETVRRQDYSDWEIIISDNYSEEDIAGYVHSLNDLRIKYFRTEKFIPVTDNWNNALDKSEGDYVIMLGDDDGLMQGYFSVLSRVIAEYGAPDFIYTSAYLYAYPGVIPGCPQGFLRSYSTRKLFQSAQKPFWLEKSKAVELVKHSLNFKVSFDYNMQFSLVSRKLIRGMEKRGSFYQSPYPDYYASNAMMLGADKILVVPQPLVTIGISPKSFGFYYYNDSESKGNEFLKNIPDSNMAHRLEQVVLPGTDMNTSWLLSMETLATNFSERGDVSVNYDRYRLLQICAVFAKAILKKPDALTTVRTLQGRMTKREQVLYGVPLSMMASLSRILSERYRIFLAKLVIFATGSHPRFFSPRIKGKFSTILDVFEQVAPAPDRAEKAG
ncbi:MAG: glycosyltransferase [Gallionellaceae bacterium]|nr:glycosyltransferase [Gallionellaceae bacterium]